MLSYYLFIRLMLFDLQLPSVYYQVSFVNYHVTLNSCCSGISYIIAIIPALQCDCLALVNINIFRKASGLCLNSICISCCVIGRLKCGIIYRGCTIYPCRRILTCFERCCYVGICIHCTRAIICPAAAASCPAGKV